MAKKPVNVSEVDDTIDETLVQQASKPDLATLYRRAKKKGYIKPIQEYQSTG